MKKIYFSLFLGLLFFSSCDKSEIATADFEVSTDKLTYKLGDTVKFKFKGAVDYITMYSGEIGFRYEFKDRTHAIGQLLLDISANLRNANGANTLSVLATTALTEARDSTEVVNAPWIDISSRMAVPIAITTTSKPFGTADITDLYKEGKPIYFALKHKSSNSATAVQPRWTVTVFNVVNKLPDGTALAVGTLSNAGWKGISVKNPVYAWITSGGLFTNAPAINSGDTENWVVTKPLIVDAVNKDYGVSIKDLVTAMPKEYPYIYKARGKYKITFVGLNSRNDQSSNRVKEVEITVE